jgi:serine/threonine protein kinase
LAALSARDEGAEGLRHIVRYYQAWIEDERLYIQTELCDASLESRVRRGRFLPTPPAVWSFLRQMLLALELLHARGLVHLDLKPGNIFVKGEDPRGRSGGLDRVRFLPPRSRPGGREARAGRLGRGVCVTQARTATN